MTDALIKNPWAGGILLLGLVLLFFMVARDLGGKVPRPPDFEARLAPSREVVPVSQIEPLFQIEVGDEILALTGQDNLFHTTHFIPPPAPVETPPPEPPPVRKIEFTYHGFYRGAEGEPRAFISLGEELLVRGAGQALLEGLVLKSITFQTLTLTNAAGEKITLEFNAKKTLEFPK